MFKKVAIYSIISCMLLSLVGCNSNDTQSTQVGISEPIEEDITTTTKMTTIKLTTTTQKELTMQERLENSTWGGCDGDGNIFSMKLTEDEISTYAVTSSGYEIDIDGYWELDEDNEKIIVYSDEKLTDQITYYDYIPITLENDEMLMTMEGMNVSLIEEDKNLYEIAEEITSNYNILTNSIENETYWVGESDINVDFFTRNYSDFYIYMADKNSKDDEDENTEYLDGVWGLTYDYFYIDDETNQNFVAFKWSFDAYTSKLTFTSMDTDNIAIEFSLTEATSFNEAIDLVNAHLDGTYQEETTTTQEETTTEETTQQTTIYWGQSTETIQTTLAWVTFDTTYNYFETTYDVNVNNPYYDDSAEYYDDYIPYVTNSYAMPITTTAYYDNYNNYNNYNNYSTGAYGFE
ncbi:MAG: hypothetical protein ACI4WH_02990 [Oscillospiraceae bacterium]